MELLFDDTNNTELVKKAILIFYDSPNTDWDEAMEILAIKGNIRNGKNAYQIIYRSIKKAFERHDKNFSKFNNILPPAFIYTPTTKNFIECMARYLHKVDNQKEKCLKATY